MREWKNKEVIAGLVVIIILGVIALFLLIRREIKNSPEATETVATDSQREGLYEGSLEEPGEDGQETEGESEVKKGAAGGEAATQSGPKESFVPGENSGMDGAAIIEEKKQLYQILGEERYKPATMIERKEEDGQLAELFGYWDEYMLEAVDDLIHLERIMEISAQLNGTNNFYYYGDVDSLGRPSGKGLAVYGNNTYYCGGWKEGLRSGKGMWLQAAVYDDSNADQNKGVIEHIYNGSWSKDLPNGQGQEHFTYDYHVLNQKSRTVTNVIGEFKDGYYNGEMYVMTTDNNGNTSDWSGNCRKGVWDILLEGNTTKAIWRTTDVDEKGDYQYHFAFPEENSNQGVYGLKK